MEALCVGFSSVDLIVRGMDRLPAPGDHTAFVDSMTLTVGGDAANQSIALARLGHDVGLMTLVGEDIAGDTVLAALRTAGVDSSRVARSGGIPTSLCLADVKESGERAFVAPRHGTASAFGAEHVPADPLPPELRVVSIGSLNCSRSLDADVLPALLAEARAKGITTVADMVSDHPDIGLDELEPVLRQVDYLVPSELELALYTGTADPVEAFEVVAQYGVGALIVKQGARGATLVRPGLVARCDALPVRVVDTTGAGDCFVAGFVSGLLLRLPDAELLRRAVGVAALSVRSVGATEGVTGPEDLARVLAEQRV